MPDLNITRINGVPYSWHSCAHFFLIPATIPYKGILSVDYSETREVKVVHAGQQDGTPLGITAGKYLVDNFVIRMLRSSAHNLMQDLSLIGAGSFGDAQFGYALQLFEPALQIPPELPSLTTLSGCRITKVAEKQEMGVDELVTELTIQAQFLRRVVGGTPVQLWSAVRTLLP